MMRWIVLAALMALGVDAMVAAVHAAEGELKLPAAEATAASALLHSPRHGEWVDVPMAGEKAPLRTWVVYPERADRAPVVLVIHEIFGLTGWIRAVADALAAEGYIAVAPDLLSGKGPAGGGTESFAGDAVRAAVQKLGDEEMVARMNAVRQYALALPAASGKSAVIGFCWGGRASFFYATKQTELDAAVVYYGTGPEAVVVRAAMPPVLGLYGGDDARVTATVPATEQAMKAAGRSFEAKVYEGAGHGFLRQQEGRDGANAKAATAAWRRTLDFFSEHLAGAGSGAKR